MVSRAGGKINARPYFDNVHNAYLTTQNVMNKYSMRIGTFCYFEKYLLHH